MNYYKIRFKYRLQEFRTDLIKAVVTWKFLMLSVLVKCELNLPYVILLYTVRLILFSNMRLLSLKPLSIPEFLCAKLKKDVTKTGKISNFFFPMPGLWATYTLKPFKGGAGDLLWRDTQMGRPRTAVTSRRWGAMPSWRAYSGSASTFVCPTKKTRKTPCNSPDLHCWGQNP